MLRDSLGLTDVGAKNFRRGGARKVNPHVSGGCRSHALPGLYLIVIRGLVRFHRSGARTPPERS